MKSTIEARKEEMEGRRQERVPLGVPRANLTFEGLANDKSKVYRVVNDVPGRIPAAINGGYELVMDSSVRPGAADVRNENTALGAAVSRHVGRDEQGGSKRAYLMSIPRELYEEDQKAKLRALHEQDAAIRGGRDARTNMADPNQYVPRDGIKIEEGSARF